jgi:hypothetical protein
MLFEREFRKMTIVEDRTPVFTIVKVFVEGVVYFLGRESSGLFVVLPKRRFRYRLLESPYLAVSKREKVNRNLPRRR